MPAHVHSERCQPGCARKRDSAWHAIWTGRRPDDQPLVRRAILVLLGLLTTLGSALALELKASHELSAQLVTAVTVTNEKVATSLDGVSAQLAAQAGAFEWMRGAATGHLSCPPCPPVVCKPSPCPPPLPCPPAQVYVQQAPLPTGPSAGGKRP